MGPDNPSGTSASGSSAVSQQPVVAYTLVAKSFLQNDSTLPWEWWHSEAVVGVVFIAFNWYKGQKFDFLPFILH